jgi:hypothetical protein
MGTQYFHELRLVEDQADYFSACGEVAATAEQGSPQFVRASTCGPLLPANYDTLIDF